MADQADLKDFIVESDSAKETKVAPTQEPKANEDGVITLSDADLKGSDVVNESPELGDIRDLAYDPEVTSQFTPEKDPNVIQGFDKDEFSEYLGEDIIAPETDDPLRSLAASRAIQQSSFEQFMNFTTQAIQGEIVGGAIEGAGYLLDWQSLAKIMTGQEDDFTNWLSDIGKDLKQTTRDLYPIYEDPRVGEGFSNKMSDWGWWMSNSVSVASTLSMLVPTVAASKGLSFVTKALANSKKAGLLGKGAKAYRGASTQQRWMTKGITQAVMSRNIENFMEAHGTYESAYNDYKNQIDPETNELMSDSKAKELASKAAASNWKLGWAMVMQDAMQYLALGRVFNPVSKKMEGAVSGMAGRLGQHIKPWQKNVVAGLGSFVSEGAEEGYQYMISQMSKAKVDLEAGLITKDEYDDKFSEYFWDEEFKTSAFFGGLGGSVFQVGGTLLNKYYKSKAQRELEEKYGQDLQDRIKNNAGMIHAINQMISDKDGLLSEAEVMDVQKKYFLPAMIDAIENNKYDEFIAQLESVADMSQDDLEAMAAEEITFDKEKAKKNLNEIKKLAEEVKSDYLKIRNKYDSPIIARQVATKNYVLKADKATRNRINEAFDGFMDEVDFVSEDQYAITSLEAKISSAERVFDRIKKETRSKPKKKNGRFIWEAKNNALKNLAEEIRDMKDELKDRKKSFNEFLNEEGASPRELRKRKRNAERAEEDASKINEDLLSVGSMLAEIDHSIDQTRKELNYYSDKANSNSIIKNHKEKVAEAIAENMKTSEEAEQNENDVDKNPNITPEEKAQHKEAIKKKGKELKEKEEAEEAAANAAEVEASQKSDSTKKTQDSLDSPSIMESNESMEDSVEDSLAYEDVDVNEQIASKTDRSEEEVQNSSSHMSLLDFMNQAANYEAWLNGEAAGPSKIRNWWAWTHNGESKAGESMTIRLSTHPRTVKSTNNRISEVDLMEAFWNLDPSEPTPEMFYHNLPIEVAVTSSIDSDGNSKIYTFLPTSSVMNAGEKSADLYENVTYPQRVAIIDNLRKGGRGSSVETRISYTSGGKLNSAPNEDGSYRNTILTDLSQVDNVDDIEILISDENGSLMDTQKNLSSEFESIYVEASRGADNSKRAMGGAVFMVVKRADGSRMPMKLNLGFMERGSEKMDLLAPLMIQNMTMNSLIFESGQEQVQEGVGLVSNSLDESTLERIAEVFSDEIEILKEAEVPVTFLNLFDVFFNISPDTEGKMSNLRFADKGVRFGPKNSLITENTFNNVELRNEFIDYLTTVKRRQFNIKLWRSSEKYRKYAVETGLITSDVKANEPMFISDPSTRRVQVWVNPVEQMRPEDKVGAVKQPKTTPAPLSKDGSVAYDPETGPSTVLSLDSLKKQSEKVEEKNNKPEISKGVASSESPTPKKKRAATKTQAEEGKKRRVRKEKTRLNTIVKIDKKPEKEC